MSFASAALRWRADEFWSATPHEFWSAYEGWERMNKAKEG